MITTTALRSLREGVVIQNELTRPCRARHLAPPPIPPRIHPFESVKINRRPGLSWSHCAKPSGQKNDRQGGLPNLAFAENAIGVILA